MDGQVQLYVNVDSNGNITSTYSGKDILMTQQYHYCFIRPEEVADKAHLYKVVINEMVPDIVLKEVAK